MGDHTATDFHNPEMAIPGHMSSLVYVHQTKTYGLHCGGDEPGDGCGWFCGSFRPDRWRDKHMREAWQRHVAYVEGGGVIEHGQATNVKAGVCACVRCMIPHRKDNDR